MQKEFTITLTRRTALALRLLRGSSVVGKSEVGLALTVVANALDKMDATLDREQFAMWNKCSCMYDLRSGIQWKA